VSEDRLVRIESKLDGLAGTVETLAGTVVTLVVGQAKLEARLEAGLEELRAGQLSLGSAMRVLYEDTLDRMKALDPVPLFATLRREMAEAHEGVIRRLDVIEVAVSELWRRQAPQ